VSALDVSALMLNHSDDRNNGTDFKGASTGALACQHNACSSGKH